jgi:hypothetical protein
MGDDGLAVADDFPLVDDEGKLPSWGLRRVEKMFMDKRQPDEPKESENLEAIAIVVGHAEKRRIGL